MGSSRVRIVTGKGGVGKTSVATALALCEARRGQRVLLAEAHGGDQVARLLGAKPVGSQLREVLERLYVVDMNPADAMHEYALLTLRFETVYKAVFGNRLVRNFVALVPSLGELTMLGKLWYHAQQTRDDGAPRFDVLILDAPATGHAISMLRSPKAVAETVPPGAMRDNCRLIDALLTDRDRTELHIVTTPEEMPVNEAVELERAANDILGIAVGTTFINQRVPPVSPEIPERVAELPGPWAEAAGQTLATRRGKVRAGDNHLARLPTHMLADRLDLPRLPSTVVGLEGVEALAACIARDAEVM